MDIKEATPETKLVWATKKNPKREGSKAHARAAKYWNAKTVEEYLKLGGTNADLKYDAEKAFFTFEEK